MVGDVGLCSGEPWDAADPAADHLTEYDRSPVDTFSTSDYSPSPLDTSPSDSVSSNQSTFPSIDPNAPERSFASPRLQGGGDASLGFGVLYPSAPGFYPFHGSTSSDSPGDPLGGIALSDLVSRPGAVFPTSGAGTVGDSTYATTRFQHRRQLSIDDRLMMTGATLLSNRHARLTLEADGVSPRGATVPSAPGASRPLRPNVPRPASFAAGVIEKARTRLRSASSISKNSVHRSSDTPQERKDRARHNTVEKKYRDRLNGQYERLINSLPPAMQSPTYIIPGDSPGDSSEQAGKPLSKGEVLERSMAYIQELERSQIQLREENEALSMDIGVLWSVVAGARNIGGPGRLEGC